MLKALKDSGAEIWLLTDFEPRLEKSVYKNLPKRACDLIYAARVMEGLMEGHNWLHSPYWETKLSKWQALARLHKKWLRLLEILDWLAHRNYATDAMVKVNLLEQFDSPYFRQEKLSYFGNLDGILCARYLYLNASRRALARRPSSLPIKLGNEFDGLITTCPINIRVEGKGCLVQTVHDLIPLEYVQTSDHVANFGQRLNSCLPARKLYVSQATRKKFEQAYGSANDAGGIVILQPPSLKFPAKEHRGLLEQKVLRPSLRTKNHHGELVPFRYLLFNSSVEPRKNLLFAVKAFRISGLAEHGIRLCVTGMLKKDSYSREVAKQADESVLLTGYIDEATKSNLFLHAMAVISPSLVEGFGIPVLDGACIGAPVIASPSVAHREIQASQDFRELIWLCDTLDPTTWAEAMGQIAKAEMARIGDPQAERQRRLSRYDTVSAAILEDFRRKICEQVKPDQLSK
ncbi:glycosyltransferase [Cyanobium sp. WAJ14-Wanaka]|uniref:glycosyltransferase n=1 Tax=Cyanobium sp. WAJ14-Wanaka TaxID=2823725 RepID=UPI0020CF2726|nr:glycosyltransferase [Cyanobium sp. WAJ14-Wanaka]MCP9775701.1 glycosyltransferase [Cyanobium sp. WAJ14-Wanaka]